MLLNPKLEKKLMFYPVYLVFEPLANGSTTEQKYKIPKKNIFFFQHIAFNIYETF